MVVNQVKILCCSYLSISGFLTILSLSLFLFQMLGCMTRGFSFTRALLGISADELHLCGDPAAVPLIQEILKPTGDDIHVSFLKLARQYL